MKGATMNAPHNDSQDRPDERRPCNRKVYTGRRGPEGCVVWVIDESGEPKPLNPCWELRNHSPTGFEWDMEEAARRSSRSPFSQITSTNDRAALNLYQRFKWACIAQIRGASWSLSGEEIDNWLTQLSGKQEDTEFPTGSFTR